MPARDSRAFLTASSTAYFATLHPGFWKALCTSWVPWAWEFWEDMYHHHPPTTASDMNYKKLF
ncbi:hypothetical protein ACRE_043520 [Hapsidospora chrysogenum ATCC 11550]|uniref:Uncharacterized protein n=1 Tax=Hapsidospora chrysogenum (strain ATCC 11550 / CBS 779.69 / DSM 880 / IAM 14645 / JCM 23072 / IMI 49137) TaxID=857340 RepID=A0A086T684_HAPC1|nr:hypothetical protein ACRE_043520 [Hapsidospora chrysogenum ATCC 11550]